MQDRLKKPVSRGNRLVDPLGDIWTVMLPALGNEAHLMNTRSGKRVRADVAALLRMPVGWRENPDLSTRDGRRRWYAKETANLIY